MDRAATTFRLTRTGSGTTGSGTTICSRFQSAGNHENAGVYFSCPGIRVFSSLHFRTDEEAQAFSCLLLTSSERGRLRRDRTTSSRSAPRSQALHRRNMDTSLQEDLPLDHVARAATPDVKPRGDEDRTAIGFAHIAVVDVCSLLIDTWCFGEAWWRSLSPKRSSQTFFC